MSVVESTNKLNAAVNECLAECFFSPSPAVCLAKFLNRLMATGQWTTDELASVRSAVVRILRRIAAPEEDDGLPIGFNLEARF